MATKLFLRESKTNGISNYYDMVTTQGSASSLQTFDTVASVANGTEIQWTDVSGGTTVAWISGRAPVSGFTLTTTDISVACWESNMSANCGGRYRLFKRTLLGIETELLSGPFNDGVEFSSGVQVTDMTWTGNVTDTVFVEDDRLLLKLYITNVGTMGGPYTCEVYFDAASGGGVSFLNLAETVSFKAEGGGAATNPGWSGKAGWF